MLYREMIDLKFRERQSLRDDGMQVAASGGMEPRRPVDPAEDEGLSTRNRSLAFAASVAGNMIGGAALLLTLVMIPLWLERILALLP